jgi:glycosyltransferase involved in cell wall biosynthesis
MISVVIPTLDSERLLVPTLSALVAGSAAGLVREVVLADGGSRDDTEKIADEAGCEFLPGTADEGERLAAAAAAARGDWLLFLDPGAVVDESWPREVAAFMGSAERTGNAMKRAAGFRLSIDGHGLSPRLAEAAAVLRFAAFGLPRPDQGLLIAKRFYRSLGGHAAGPHPRRRLLGKIGRGGIVTLRTRIILPAEGSA